MKLPNWIIERLHKWAIDTMLNSEPHLYIGGEERPYLIRWLVLPQNAWFNVYLHYIIRSDDDRAHHDHPWPWLSIMLEGVYEEHRVRRGGVIQRKRIVAGSVRAHSPWYSHRLEITKEASRAITLFIRGPKVREWGFHCPNGWRNWKIFTNPLDGGATIGRGCE